MLRPAVYENTLLDNLFDSFPFFDDKAFGDVEKKLYGHNAGKIMSTDVKETDTAYELEMDLPGFKKEEITVTLDNGYLTVQAAKGLDKSEEEKETGRYIRRERYSGSCSRSFFVGDHLVESDIAAEFKHGILKLTVPKIDPASRTENKKLITIA